MEIHIFYEVIIQLTCFQFLHIASLLNLVGNKPSSSFRARLWYYSIILTLPLQWIQSHVASNWMIVSIVHTVSIKGYKLPYDVARLLCGMSPRIKAVRKPCEYYQNVFGNWCSWTNTYSNTDTNYRDWLHLRTWQRRKVQVQLYWSWYWRKPAHIFWVKGSNPAPW